MNIDAQALIGLSGWIALGLLAPAIAWVYYARRRSAGNALPFRARLRPHQLLGYAILGFALVHALIAAAAGTIAEAAAAGINAASFALALLIAQAFIGVCLIDPGRFRKPLRTWHFRLMFAVVVVAIVHAILNTTLLSLAPS